MENLSSYQHLVALSKHGSFSLEWIYTTYTLKKRKSQLIKFGFTNFDSCFLGYATNGSSVKQNEGTLLNLPAFK